MLQLYLQTGPPLRVSLVPSFPSPPAPDSVPLKFSWTTGKTRGFSRARPHSHHHFHYFPRQSIKPLKTTEPYIKGVSIHNNIPSFFNLFCRSNTCWHSSRYLSCASICENLVPRANIRLLTLTAAICYPAMWLVIVCDLHPPDLAASVDIVLTRSMTFHRDNLDI